MPDVEVVAANQTARAAISLALQNDHAGMEDLLLGLNVGELQYMAASASIMASVLVRTIAATTGRSAEDLWQEMCQRTADHEVSDE